MAFIDKLKEELDRAGRAAQGAIDEGKTRLEGFRTRQLADKAAQALGYAVFRAKQGGGEIDADTYSRLAATLATHDAEASRYEQELEQKRTDQPSAGTASSTTADTGPTTSSPADTTSTSSGTASGSASSPYASSASDSPPPPPSQDVSG